MKAPCSEPFYLASSRALALQRELLHSYSAGPFQIKLDELQRTHGAHSGDFAAARRAAIREVQAEVLPKFGFEASDEGVRRMVIEFDSLYGDREIQSLAREIDDALRCDARGGLSRLEVVQMLQEQVEALAAAQVGEMREGEDEEGMLPCGQLEDRFEAAKEYLRPALLRYGFDGTPLSVRSMLGEVSKYLHDSRVSVLFAKLNNAVGMNLSESSKVKRRLCLSMKDKFSERVADSQRPDSKERLEVSGSVCMAVSNTTASLLSLLHCEPLAAAHSSTAAPGLALTKARAEHLLSDLLMAFSSSGFQRKLQALVDRAISVGCGDLRDIPGRKDLVRKAEFSVLPKHGFAGDEDGLMKLVRALRPLLGDHELIRKVDAMERRLRIAKATADAGPSPSSAASTASPPSSPTADAEVPQARRDVSAQPEVTRTSSRVSLSRSQAVELLTTLLAAYSAPTFVRTMQRTVAVEEDVKVRMELFDHHVRSVQMDVLPAFGIRASSRRNKDLETALLPLCAKHADVAALAASTEAALSMASSLAASATVVSSTPAATELHRQVKKSLLSRNSLTALLREQLNAYSALTFQRDVRQLKEDAQFDAPTDGYHLPGRDELEHAVLNRLMPRYGLDRGADGMRQLKAECMQHASDPEITRLLLEITRKLMMDPIARRRYIDRLRDEAEQQLRQEQQELPAYQLRQRQQQQQQQQQQDQQEQHEQHEKQEHRSRRGVVPLQELTSFAVSATSAAAAEAVAGCVGLCKPIANSLALPSKAMRFLSEGELALRPASVSALGLAQARAIGGLQARRAVGVNGCAVSSDSALMTMQPEPKSVAPQKRRAEAPSRETSAVKLSKFRAEAIFHDLEHEYRPRLRASLRKLTEALDVCGCREKSLETSASAQIVMDVLREVLPRYRFDGSGEGLRLIWQAAKPLLDDRAAAIAEELVDELLGKLRAAAPPLLQVGTLHNSKAAGCFTATGTEEADQTDGASDIGRSFAAKAAESALASIPTTTQPTQLTVLQAEAMHKKLLASFTMPSFQKRLSELYRSSPATSSGFGVGFADLCWPRFDAAFETFGLPAASEDLAGALGALGPFYAQGTALAAAVDEALFAPAEAEWSEKSPLVSSASPKLRDVVGALRAQLGCFSLPGFQTRLQELKAVSSPEAQASGYFVLKGRQEEILRIQEEVLPLHGFEGSRRGAHALLARSAQLSFVPQVCALLDAINTKLGMDPGARRRSLCRIKVFLPVET